MSESSASGTLYPYHPEAWRELRESSEAALTVSELGKDVESNSEPFIANIWRVRRLGFACRLERPLVDVGEETVYTFGFEDDVPGNRYFGKVPYISAGLRRPAARNPRNHGVLEYSQAQGLLKEPKGRLPNNYLRAIVHVEDLGDPEQRIFGFENLLKDLLGYAPHSLEEPLG